MNKGITEDYVSYEIAKLLKEKGFDEPYCNCYLLLDEGGYTEVEMSDECHQGERYDSESSSWKFGTLLLRPTHQMALKWLREVYKIIISFNASFVNSIEPHFSWNIRINSLKSLNDKEHFEPIYINSKSESFEESCEAALKYTLENLI